MMVDMQLTQINKFDQLIQDFPESAAKIYVMKLLSKVKQHLKLPAFMRNNELLEVQVTELVFLTALINIFSLSLTIGTGGDVGKITIGKSFAIFNSLYNALPCTLSFLVGDKNQRMVNFKKIAINFVKMSTFFGVFYPVFFSIMSKSEQGIDAQFAVIKSVAYGVGICHTIQKAAVVSEALLKRLINVDDDSRGYFTLGKDPKTEKQNAAFKQDYLVFSDKFASVTFLFFVLFISVMLFIASMPNNADILGAVGLVNNPFGVNNILSPVLLIVSTLINYVYDRIMSINQE